ncbi:MAG TPA: 5-oxoprolinase subunit PxpA [Gemmatimonadaceae bacterium]|nr:5-oxoprolinase subunit PxpA [Gemmatimonadaceae bacterium]
MLLTIDLNADLGEGFGTARAADDLELLDLVSSANIACGFHAGDEVTMRDTVRAARERGVSIGAHPSYPDIRGFGRRELGLSPREIEHHVSYQLHVISNVCAAQDAKLVYVKPHGALYNRAAWDPKAAEAICRAIAAVDGSMTLLGLPSSAMSRAAEDAGVRFANEAFVDRAYTPDGRLVPRSEPGAVIHDVQTAVSRSLMLVHEGVLGASDGTELRIAAQSLCVHGDNIDASAILRRLRRSLEESGVRIAPFAA